MSQPSLAQQLADKAYVGWTPKSKEHLHALAVIAGDKPAALVTLHDDEPEFARELQALARQHGCKALICTAPDLVVYGGSEPYIHFAKDMLLYRDDKLRGDYIQLMQEWYGGTVSGNDYSQRLGTLLGYKKEDVDAFVKDSPLPEGENGSELLALARTAPNAVYEQLSRDPILAALLPPRKLPRIEKD